MDQSPAYILAQYLISEAVLIEPSESGDWKVYVGALPDGETTDHNAVGCIDTAPVKDGRVMGSAPLFHPGVQLMVRATDYNVGYAKADEIATALAAVQNVDITVDSTDYEIANVSQASGVVVLGQESGTKRRWLFSVNFTATLKEV